MYAFGLLSPKQIYLVRLLLQKAPGVRFLGHIQRNDPVANRRRENV
jgi:hypothetical protein